MELKIIRCPQCGAEGKLAKEFENGVEIWKCAHCGGKFTEESTSREYERLESTVKASLGSVIDDALIKEKTEKYYNLRSMLWEKVTAKYIDSNSILSICRDIKRIDPHDFLADFFEITNSKDDADISEYISTIDVRENALFLDLVIDFLTRSLKESYITQVAALLDRAGLVLSPADKQKHLTRFENEASKVQEGLYDLNTPKDVFLAYSSKDMQTVVEILKFIEESGLTCFAAFRNLQHGRDAVANYERALQTAIDNSSIFVFLSSVNSRNQSCDAFKREIPYIRQRDLQKYPEARTYSQLPDKYKMLKVEYRLDNRPTPIADRMLKDFFSGLTYAENLDQLIDRLGDCMELLNSPIADEDSERLAEETRRREDAERRLREMEDAERLRRAEEAERRLRELQDADQKRREEETRRREEEARRRDEERFAEERRLREEAESRLRELEAAEKARKAEEERKARSNTSVSGASFSSNIKKFTYDNGYYEGNVLNGKKHGWGKYVWNSGNVFEGDWVDDSRTGKGKLIWASGDIYEGDWVQSKRTGKGKYVWTSGTVYEGDFLDDKKHGYGKQVWGEGQWKGHVYEGQWKYDKRTGKGKYSWPAGTVYEGDFYEDKKHGWGRQVWGEGQWKGHVYEGEWQNDNRTGKGKYTWTDGSSYDGEWVNGSRTGKGRYTWADGASYDGEWSNSNYHGRGIYTFANGQREERVYNNGKLISSKPLSSTASTSSSYGNSERKVYDNGVYEGSFKDGNRHGRGKYSWNTGDVYEGAWVNGNRTGKGHFTWGSGTVYDGDFLDNKKHGYGKQVWASGDVYEGAWINDKRTGKGKYVWKSGTVYEGDFYDDQKHGRGRQVWGEGQWKGHVYDGEWKNDNRDGKGKYSWPDGTSYEGEWRNNTYHGKGIYTFANGKREERVYDNGKLISSKKKFF